MLAPVSAVADVLALWGYDGWLTPPLAPVVRSASVVRGRALTVQVAAGDTGPGLAGIYDVLSGDLADRVVVIAGAEEGAGRRVRRDPRRSGRRPGSGRRAGGGVGS
ncbi:MAG: hypothetical protein R2713_22420 [Ilumatobacteraceae bacterium]